MESTKHLNIVVSLVRHVSHSSAIQTTHTVVLGTPFTLCVVLFGRSSDHWLLRILESHCLWGGFEKLTRNVEESLETKEKSWSINHLLYPQQRRLLKTLATSRHWLNFVNIFAIHFVRCQVYICLIFSFSPLQSKWHRWKFQKKDQRKMKLLIGMLESCIREASISSFLMC